MIEFVAQTGLNSIYSASYIALISVGLVLIFGVMGVLNFAHGELYMVGAYVVVALFAQNSVPFFVAVAAGMIFVGCIGLLMERALFRPLRSNPLAGLVASIGFLMILQSLAVLGFGVRMEHIPKVTDSIIVFSDHVRLPMGRAYVIIAAVVMLSLLWFFLKKTKFGWALRASAQDPQAAQLQGISVKLTAQIAMFVGAAYAGLAGALTAPLVSVNPLMGHSVIITAFIVIIVGGVGSLGGAVIASVIYAIVHTVVTTFYDGVLADLAGLALMLIVLIVKPTGLFGSAQRA